IRVETIGYFLKRYREDMLSKSKEKMTIEDKLREFEEKIRKNFELQEKLKENQYKESFNISSHEKSPTIIPVEEIKIRSKEMEAV
ncbi:MAG: hypothetical protein ABI840_01140, partial [bacterium]